ncbi:DNA primase [Endozoicomonas sp. OPT23]|uniref:DNA primase n=1 Tax=Endozoicomonas sp. OPT23 TaxID=2072845 RepID=UPI00129A69EF|nr:DNA primase [Endozoicomonas sp. OPT23]MRI31815.1 DNA primase [Endozoicomonas sp. OPT23]
MAGRIPQTFIDDLLSRIDIVDIVDSRVKLKKTGRNYSACCPFHQEKSPSFTVSPDKQFYYCFGCGASGNALGFVMDFDHLDFPAAIDNLSGLMGMEVPREQGTSRNHRPDYSELYELMRKASSSYEEQLRKANDAPKAIGYLKNRGLDGQTCKSFGIGYAPSGWDHLHKLLGDTQEKEGQLVKTGMLVENEESKKRYDRFRDRIMFPIRDSRGRIIAFGGRVLGDAKPKYLNSPESPIFHKGRELYGLYEAKQNNRNLERVIVVEGYMDVVALAQLGISYAVATLGTATTLDHMQRLFKMVPEVVFCFDGDDAGRRAAWRALESTLPVMQDGKQARFLFLPQGEDPDSMVRQEGKEAFLERIKVEALSLDNFLFRELEDGLNLDSMDGRARLTKLAQPYVGKLPDSIFKKLVLQRLSDLTGLDSNTLETHLAEEQQQKQTTPAEPIQQNEPPAYINEQVMNYDPAHIDSHMDQHRNDHRVDHYGYQEYAQPSGQQFFKKRGKGFNKGFQQPAPAAPLKVGLSIYAIRHLLCNTELAVKVEQVNSLEQDNHPDTQLLLELIKALQLQPNLSTIALIAQWHGTTKGERLQHVATLELGHEPNDAEFWEAIQRIRERGTLMESRSASEALRQSLTSKKPSQIDSDDKSRLEALLEKQRQRFGVKDSSKS